VKGIAIVNSRRRTKIIYPKGNKISNGGRRNTIIKAGKKPR
jgi:hypothetical protein